jgi:hypothetical protein
MILRLLRSVKGLEILVGILTLPVIEVATIPAEIEIVDTRMIQIAKEVNIVL